MKKRGISTSFAGGARVPRDDAREYGYVGNYGANGGYVVEKENVPYQCVNGKYLPRENKPDHTPVVYICSSYEGSSAAEVRGRIRQARRYCRFALRQKAVPVAPHLLYPQFLDGEDIHERALGMYCAKRLLYHVCEEVWVFMEDGLSDGMKEELDLAKRLGRRIRFFNGGIREVDPDERGL